MFRIDKSSVDYSNFDKSFVTIKKNPYQDSSGKGKRQQKESEDFDQYVPGEQEAQPAGEKRHYSGEENAANIVHNAEARATQLIEKALKNATEIKKSAWDEGYREGWNEGAAAVEKAGQKQAEELKSLLSELDAFKNGLYNELEKDVLALSLDIAEKIVNTELEKDDSMYIAMVKKAISRLNIESRFVLRVNPREFKRFFKDGAEWLQAEMQCAPFVVTEDAMTEENGCVLESDDGMVNAGAGTQLKMLALSLNMGETEKP